MADGQLNTSLKEVNDLITQLDKNAQDANKHIKDMFSGKVSFTGLDTIKQAMSDILELDAKLSARKQKGKVHYDYGIDPDFVKDATRKISDSLDKSEAELTDKVNKIVRSILTTARFMSVQQISNSSQELGQAGTTVAQNIKDSLMSQLQQNTGLIAQEAQKQAERIKAAYLSATNAATGYGMYQAASRVPVESNAFSQNLSEISSSDYAGVIKQQAAELRASLEAIGVPEMEIINRLKEMSDLATASAEKEIAKVKGVITAYDEWKATLDGIQQKQLELNVKKEAGIFNAQDQQEQLKLINDMRTAKEGIARIDKTTEQVEREMMQKQASDIRRLNELWDENRRLVTRLKELNSKPANERTKSEQELLDKINKKLTTQEVELDNLQNKYRGVAEAEHVFAEQQMRDIENRIRAERDLAKANAPKVSLGSTTGDVTTVSGAYRTQIKLYEEENRLLRERQALRKELTTRITNDADTKHLEEIDRRLNQIKKDRETIANTPLFKSASDQAKLDYAARQTAEVRKRTNEATMSTASWAVENARVARSYQQLRTAAENIRNVQQNTELTKQEARQLAMQLDSVEKKIKRCEKAMGTFKAQSMSLKDVVSQLAQGLGIMFSLQQVTQFARKIVEIRGEFELQEVALKAIVQDSLKGQEIWNETVQNALKSPFSVKQLVTYTKQLAAYRIETDKLVDTTRRLADISAGLGVDMQRLILAYGQVKAANYLRASEVRQFTEAGVNMYGELSKYFSEIEGRAISTADVVERVSKRMVSFEDVAEVFKRMTDEGGVFYNMQEIQSETVRGQVMKLRDAFDLMLNDIGESSQGTIKGIVSLLLDLTKHWKDLIPLIEAAVAAIVSAKVVIPLLQKINTSMLNNIKTIKGTGYTLESLSIQTVNAASVWQRFGVVMTYVNAQGMKTYRMMGLLEFGLKTLGHGVARLGSAIWTFMKSNVITLAISGITYLISKLVDANRATREFHATLQKHLDNGAQSAEELAAKYVELANTATDATKKEEERNDALNSLKNQYSDILPQYMLEIGYLQSITDGYVAATDAIKNYGIEKERQLALEDVRNTMSSEIETDREDIAEGLRGEGFMRGGMRDSSGNVVDFTNAQSERIASQFKQWMDDMLNEGRVATYTEAWKKLQEIVTNTTGKVLDEKITEQNGKIDINIRNLIDDYSKLVGQINTVNARFDESTAAGKYYTQINDLREQLNAESGKKGGGDSSTKSSYETQIKDLENRISKLNTLRDFEQKITDYEEGLNKDINDYSRVQKQVVAQKERQARIAELEAKKAEEITEAEKTELEHLKAREKYSEDISSLSDKNKEMFGTEGDDTLHDEIELANKSIEKRLAMYDELSKELADKKTELEAEMTNADEEYAKALQAEIVAIENRQETLVEQSAKLSQTWVVAWNNETEESIKKLDIDKSNKELKRFVDKLAAKETMTAKQVGEEARKNQKEIQEQIELYERVLAASGKELAESITGITADILPALKELQKLSKERADEILGEEKKSQRSGPDPYQGRLNVLKGIFENARKVNKELYGVQVSAEKAIEKYQKAFETAFGKGRNAKGLWSVIVEQLKTAWDGGENTEQFIAALEQMQKSGFVPKKDLEKFQEFLSETKLTLGIENRKIDRDRIKKEFDQLMSDLNLSKELEKMGTPVEFYELFGLDKEEQTVDKIREKVKAAYDKLRDENGVLGEEDERQYQEFLNKLNEMEKKDKQDRMKTYLKYLQRELTEVEKAYYEFEKARNEINVAFADNETARDNALLGANREFQKKIAAQRWKDLKGSDMYTMLFSDLDNVADETLEQLRKSIVDFMSDPTIKNNLTSSELRHIQEQIDKIDDLEQKRHPFRHLGEDIDFFWKQLAKGEKSKAIEKQRAQLEKVMRMREQYQRLQQRAGEAQANMQAGFITDAEYQRVKQEADDFEEQLNNEERQLDKDTRAVNRFRLAHERLASSLEKAGDEIKSITQSATSMYTNWMKMTGRMGDANDQMVQSINQMANDVGDAIGNIAKIIASEGSDITAWIGLVASIGAIISDGIDINEASIQKEIDDLTKKINTLARRVELFQKQMDKAMQMDDYFRNYNSALDSLSAKYNAIQEQYNAEQRKKNPDSEALESYKTQMDEVKDEMDALREKMRQEWGGIGESNFRSSAEEFVDAWMQAFQETGDGLSGLQDNFDEFVKNLFKKQATMRIASKMLEPLFKMIDDMVGEDGTVMRGQLDAVREKAAQIFPELNEALKALWEELGIGTDATDTLSGLQQGIQGITEATAEVIEGYLNSIRFFIAEDNMMLRQIRDAVQSGAGNAMYMELHAQTILLQRIWDKFDDITTANQTAHTMAVRIVA